MSVSEKDLVAALEKAVGDALSTLRLGMLSRMTLAIEVIDSDGDLGLFTVAAPASVPIWDRIGMLRYQLAELEAASVGDAVARRLEEDE
ncbi:hypothetical protein ACFC0K_15860 [Streptomyces hydrogenans]|uniref:hypothetical protein n=1 Tax=Streptomyces hydrogenans TaxID=1873719 RepID=UPI0035D79232